MYFLPQIEHFQIYHTLNGCIELILRLYKTKNTNEYLSF